MTDDVVVICPELPPERGGVGDYTIRVADQWRGISPKFLVAQPIEGGCEYRAEQLDPRADVIRQLAPHAKVLLQYSAYGFHRLGYPRTLLRALTNWKRENAGVLVLMLHEIWTFWPLLNKNRPIQALHRRDLAALTRSADAVFTSTRGQAEHLRDVSGRSNVEVLPVGSNIRPSSDSQPDRQPGHFVLFGLQSSRLTTLRKMHEHLRSLAARGVITKLTTTGAGNTEQGDIEEKALTERLQLRERVELRGSLPEQEVSRLLSSAAFAVSAQDESSVTKSGTFIAYAAHGLNIISPHAAATASAPLCWATHPADLIGGIAEAELRARAENLRVWHDQTCSWARIAEQFARALRLEVGHPTTAATAAP
jgi:glycosyltransferase involved in cell wall biosynthesis